MTKNALVISGGGSRGAFAVGVVDYLVNVMNLKFDIVAGTSTGLLIIPLVVTNEITRLKDLYTRVRDADILLERPLAEAILRDDVLFDGSPLTRLIDQEITPARTQKIFAAPVQMFITTVSLTTGRTVYFQTGPRAVNNDPFTKVVRITDRAELLRAINASANEPVFLPPVEVRPDSARAYSAPGDQSAASLHPTDQYTDGGVRDVAPLRIAIDNGATDIYAVILSTQDRDRVAKPFTSVIDILTRTISLFLQEVTKGNAGTARLFNEGTIYLQRLKDEFKRDSGLPAARIDELFDRVESLNPFRNTRAVSLQIIQPKTELPGSGLTFKPPEMAFLLQLGRERAKELLEGAIA